jgi:uncharacterized protein HemX
VPAAPAAGARRRRRLWVAAFVVLLALLLWAHFEVARVRNDTGRRIATLEQLLIQGKEAASRAEADARAAAQKLAVLEAQLAEEQGQREALQQLYADLSRGRDEAAVVEVERLVANAAQDLQLAGNVNAALAALQAADARLARLDNARLLPMRRALARDIERLRAAPAVDVTGMALKLDQLAQGAESWPLLSDGRPVARGAPASGSPPPPQGAANDAWARLRAWVAREFGDLVRIREVATPEALLLGPAQQQLVRQQLRLRLLGARQALLARNDRVFRADLVEAEALVTRYFDAAAPAVTAAVTQLRQLAKSALSVEVPSIGESVAASRQLRAGAAPR